MPLQKPLLGLQDFVGQFTSGQSKFELSGFVNGTVDVDDFIEPPEYIRWNGTLAALGNIVQSEVIPDNERWRVRYMGFDASVIAAGSLNVSVRPKAFDPLANRHMGLQRDTALRVNSTAGGIAGGIFTPGLILPPGSQLTWQLSHFQTLPAPGIDIEAWALIQRIRF